MAKIQSLNKLSQLIAQLKKENKKIALITGCFDIVHLGHINLFRFAKTHADIIIIGLENDSTIKLYQKGTDRPLNNLKNRLQFLAEFQSIDYVFPIKKIIKNTYENYALYEQITKRLKPDFLVTNKSADGFLQEKRNRAKKFGIKLLLHRPSRRQSSTQIIQKIESEL